ncbi:MAG: adaptor protein MecA [Clostridia bacterium]|nr:adaptor protein MecA [Clostridia bacterium]
MDINAINKNKIKISLTDEEISSLFGGYDNLDYNNPYSKHMLDMLLNTAIKNKSFSLDSERLLIEVKQEFSGCSIILTKIYATAPKRYKRMSISYNVASFKTSEDMIKCILALYNSNLNIKKSDLYLIDSEYNLILYSFVPNTFLEEYCKNISSNKTPLGYIEEYGTPLCLGDAVNRLGKIFN